ncbi:hypothetical protein [Solidesulfovibrio sp.]|uniref:hypothetical protein n=1 Tax=Solidesulfovibrio sp. TaxID=2910990 RepID=UPI002B2165DC|nr:hypothetical protein [Solidesulfovibrio sp.]MEA5090606.1 hypothetical protein [Solidesulfovibrio sp.]
MAGSRAVDGFFGEEGRFDAGALPGLRIPAAGELADFRPTARLRFAAGISGAGLEDDDPYLARLRAQAFRELGVMRRENVFELPVFSRTVRLPGGETLVCRRNGCLDSVDIHAPTEREDAPRRRALPEPHRREAGTFFAIPDCLARYEGGDGLGNAVPDGALAGWSLGLGDDVTVVSPGEAGLPEPEGLPEAGIARRRGVFALPGGAASGLLFGRGHIPDAAPFSVSCLVRLREALEYDYTYDARGVCNPFRVHLLQSADGADYAWGCPGSISPLLGFCSPHLHPDWSTTVTYPWAPWNADYAAKTETLLGAKRVETACDGAPLLAGEKYRDGCGAAYPHPWGFVIGLQAAGLFLYNGDRLLGARLSHFESQFGYAPAVSDPIARGVWHHVVMTHAADGTVRLYVAAADAADAVVYAGRQPLCAMDAACAYQASGVNAWTLRNGATGAAIGAYRMNPVMDVCLPRFFHYALSPAQAYLLQLEALAGLFVADDHEASQAVALGLTAITIPKEAS